MGKTALIVADMLNDFIDPKGALYVGDQARKLIPFIQDKIAEARAQGEPVVFLCDTHGEADHPEFKMFKPHGVPGTWGAAIIPELAPQAPDYRVEKPRYSGFYNTDLEEILTKEQVDTVAMTGVLTSICILQTVLEAFHRGFQTVVYRDGVADIDPEAHAFALNYMQRVLGAQVR
jgi:nicotinamidase/pyrazinamidase